MFAGEVVVEVVYINKWKKAEKKSPLRELYEVNVTSLEQTQFRVRNNELYHQ